jgi:hypothetical protein
MDLAARPHVHRPDRAGRARPTLAAAGDGIGPLAFVVLLAAAVLGQLLLEAFTARPGAATVWEPRPPAAPRLTGRVDNRVSSGLYGATTIT